jgi:hypothetical protein
MNRLQILLIVVAAAAGVSAVGACGFSGDPGNNAPVAAVTGTPPPAPPPAAAAPGPKVGEPWRWLPGFTAVASAEHPTRAASERLDALRPVGDECHGAGVVALQLTADVGGAEGDETVLASVAQGVVVLAPGPRDRIVAEAPIAECGGSEDATVALAVGDAWIGKPVIAVVATVGGHRASETDLALYALGAGRTLDRLYTGVLATRDGDETRRGQVIALPGALVERGPDGVVRVLPYDGDAHRFVPPAEAAR